MTYRRLLELAYNGALEKWNYLEELTHKYQDDEHLKECEKEAYNEFKEVMSILKAEEEN